MTAELLIEMERLEQQSRRINENNRRTEDEIRKLREKAYLQKSDTEKSELSMDRKLSWEPRKHPYQRLTQEQSPVKKYILLSYTATRRDIKIREVMIKILLQLRFMPVSIVISRLKLMTLCLLGGISSIDVLSWDVHVILKWKFICTNLSN